MSLEHSYRVKLTRRPGKRISAIIRRETAYLNNSRLTANYFRTGELSEEPQCFLFTAKDGEPRGPVFNPTMLPDMLMSVSTKSMSEQDSTMATASSALPALIAANRPPPPYQPASDLNR
jgi:hypothetical protein